MVAKSLLKHIRSLHQKKYRNEHGLFIVEGIKGVKEVLASQIKSYKILSTDVSSLGIADLEVEHISEAELKKISALKNPNTVLGVFHMPKPKEIDFKDWVLVLDAIQDPGNLGTIIRICDWFGIQHLVCSLNTVDCYNPKVLQATMGSITRVNVVYTDLVPFLQHSKLPVYGAFMDGASVYKEKLSEAGILVLGNEANGISEEIEKIVSQRISIPQFGEKTAESLNVATAAAILLNEIRRE